MVTKLLLPNGKILSEGQLMRLPMKQIFYIMTMLNIADKQLYEDFMSQSNVNSRYYYPKIKSRQKRKSRKYEYDTYVYFVNPYNNSQKTNPYNPQSNLRQTSCIGKNKNTCDYDIKCRWNGTSCVFN